MRELRALVVDDSSLNRRTIAAILKGIPGISNVDVANDGADALRVIESRPPDFITLDLDMPRLDGFEFLHLLMERHPLPVVVVSGLSAKENIFRALELGSIDFIEKPHGMDAPLECLRDQLAEKVRVIQQLSPLGIRHGSSADFSLDDETRDAASRAREPSVLKRVPAKVIVIGASTGGPRALLTLFRHLQQDLDAALVISESASRLVAVKTMACLSESSLSTCLLDSLALLRIGSTKTVWRGFRRPNPMSGSLAGMRTSAQEAAVSKSCLRIAALRYECSRPIGGLTMSHQSIGSLAPRPAFLVTGLSVSC